MNFNVFWLSVNNHIFINSRLIEYFQLDRPSKEDEQRMLLMHKKPKESYRTKLKTDRTLNLYISILLSIISFLICLSIPFAALESPCEILKEKEMYILFYIAKFIEENSDILDFFIVVFLIMLVYVSVRMVVDAIKNTKINISPWIEMGKYTLPPKRRRFNLSAPVGNIRHSSYLWYTRYCKSLILLYPVNRFLPRSERRAHLTKKQS